MVDDVLFPALLSGLSTPIQNYTDTHRHRHRHTDTQTQTHTHEVSLINITIKQHNDIKQRKALAQ